MDDKNDKYDLNLLRGWQRSQLELLNEFADRRMMSQTWISGASGLPQGSHALGGKITPLIRAGFIVGAGRDDEGQMMWKLNEERVERDKLLKFLKSIDINSGLATLKAKKVTK